MGLLLSGGALCVGVPKSRSSGAIRSEGAEAEVEQSSRRRGGWMGAINYVLCTHGMPEWMGDEIREAGRTE